MFVILGTMPYFYKGGSCYPCEISATSIKIDLKNGKKSKEKPSCIYTEDEVRHKLGIKLIDSWDAKAKKVVKKSNITISSIPNRKETK